MRKAKVVVIAVGLIASCLFGGFAVADAATVTLDESSTDAIETVETQCETEAIATTVTSIESTTAVTTATTRIISTTTSAATETTVETTDTTAEATTTEQEATEAPVEEVPEEEAPAPEAEAVIPEEVPEEIPAPQPEEAPTEEIIIVTEEQTIAEVAAEETITEAVAEAPAEIAVPELPEEPAEEAAPAAEAPAEAAAPVTNTTSVSDSDYVLLCNAVAHEAGSDKISEHDKALVVEVIMNRVNSPSYPDSVYGVLTQNRQFSGSSSYVNLTTFSGKVTQAVKNAVDLYFADPSQFSEGYYSFTGNGSVNYFK